MKFLFRSSSLQAVTSLPSRERGLKLHVSDCISIDSLVAPFAGAWIEIVEIFVLILNRNVAPFAGAWIEMITSSTLSIQAIVAPFAGAWIEMR